MNEYEKAKQGSVNSMWSENNIPIMMLNKWIEKRKKEKGTEAN